MYGNTYGTMNGVAHSPDDMMQLTISKREHTNKSEDDKPLMKLPIIIEKQYKMQNIIYLF